MNSSSLSAAPPPPRILSVLCLLFAAAFLFDVDAAHARTWKDRRGRTISGKLLTYDKSEGKVTLLSRGKIVSVPLKNLSDEDQSYVVNGNSTSNSVPSSKKEVDARRAAEESQNPFIEISPEGQAADVNSPDAPGRAKPFPTGKKNSTETKVRGWTTTRGAFRARFVNVVKGRVALVRGGRRVEYYAFDSLGKKDQQYIGEILKARGQEELFQALQDQTGATTNGQFGGFPNRQDGETAAFEAGEWMPPNSDPNELGGPRGTQYRSNPNRMRMPSNRGSGGTSVRAPRGLGRSPTTVGDRSPRFRRPSLPRLPNPSSDPFGGRSRPNAPSEVSEPPKMPDPPRLPTSPRIGLQPPSRARQPSAPTRPTQRTVARRSKPTRPGIRQGRPSGQPTATPIQQNAAIGFAVFMLAMVGCSIVLFLLFIAFIIWIIVKAATKPRYSPNY